MIARIWHGVTAAAKVEEYLDYLNETGVPDYRATEGNRAVYVLRRVEGERAHFLTLSFWDSMEDVKRFAGPETERAKYYPADERFLVDFKLTVEHYEVVVEPRGEA
jgi:heme-degrading monooxygenase HmoA